MPEPGEYGYEEPFEDQLYELEATLATGFVVVFVADGVEPFDEDEYVPVKATRPYPTREQAAAVGARLWEEHGEYHVVPVVTDAQTA